jgi:hypothetical protein
MAGKTLPGIGEDESGEHDAADKSDSVPHLSAGTTGGLTGARSTDRMPVAMPIASGFSGPTVVDDDKVAEGLKKLRSLDEPLGPMPMATMTTGTIQPGTLAPPTVTPVSSMPTLKEGIPVVGGPAPASIVTPAVAAAELLRSRGTAHGHALSGNAINPALLPVAVDDRMKGTLLGHSLHLPDLPEPAEEKSAPRAAEVRSIAAVQQLPPAGALRPSELVADFSNGDASFFESDATSTDFEPDRPKPNLMFRGVVFFAVVSVFAVAAFAWVNARKGDVSEAQVAAPAPTQPPPEPAAVEPPPVAPVAAEPAIAPAPEAAPAAAAPAPAPTVAEPAPAAPPDSPTAKLKRQLAAVEATKVAKEAEEKNEKKEKNEKDAPEVKAPRSASLPSATRSSRHTDSNRDVPPPAAKPTPTPTPTAKHGKAVEDPDGTLPLSD